ncbi:NADH:ubiquinone reductase (Na(+)-transporting) subunit E [Chlamydiifrater phoenicopteri]|uniref:NADH:ubiquinone reductase (Na(+)-transporting) subunit E n=1 Tax=Chlamydiifrater phoenicopteri TaxID=2681469 RepID=UPI001BCAF145|nr:NADH:ubiquinone reductase (Na(+)-transporting) subunit E [Chlamydiifrater phoenicopteri]
MLMGDYSWLGLFGILIQAVFIQNILLSNFLGMCSYLACSAKVSTANGLGMSVTLVLTVTGTINWLIHTLITGPSAFSRLSFLPSTITSINLSYLELIVFIAVIAAFTQLLEIILEKISHSLYLSLGIFLPLIAVNCAILGGVLFGITRNLPFIPMIFFCFGSGAGWWLAIVLLATINEKLTYSNIPTNLRGMGIAFITTGLMAMAFMGLTGVELTKPSIEPEKPQETTVSLFYKKTLSPNEPSRLSKIQKMLTQGSKRKPMQKSVSEK